jgi:hypothetical protein
MATSNLPIAAIPRHIFSSLLFSSLLLLSMGTIRAQTGFDPPPHLDIVRDFNPCLPEPFDYPEPENTARICDEFSIYVVSPGGTIANGTSTQYNAGDVIQGKNFDVLGAWTITAGSGTLTFRDCNFRAAAAASISVKCPNNPSAAVTITFENCNFFSCDYLWYGIRLFDSNTNPSNFGNNFQFEGCGIEDAVVGVLARYVHNYVTVILGNNTFNNNYIGYMAQTDAIFASFTFGCFSNIFMTNNELRPKAPSMSTSIVPFWPFAYTGILLQGYNATIGRPGTANLFTRMKNGVVGSLCAYRALHNSFEGLFDNGIMSQRCNALIHNNSFSQSSTTLYTYNGVLCDADNLSAYSNTLTGQILFGIQSQNNKTAERIEIYNNDFHPSGLSQYGIHVSRPPAEADPTLPGHVRINANSCSSDASDNVEEYNFIFVMNNETANDNLEIFDNVVSEFVFVPPVPPTSFTGAFINVNGLNGANHHIVNNIGHLLSAPNLYSYHGIEFSTSYSAGNHIDLNNFTGEPRSGVNDYHLFCGIHLQATGSELNLCENVVDKTHYGLHFVTGEVYPIVSRNIMRSHNVGLKIEKNAQLGDQTGRGNQWTGLYHEFAAWKDGNIINPAPDPNLPDDELLTKFRIPESNILPFLPPGNLLNPNPDLELIAERKWFRFTPIAPLSYCEPIAYQSQLSTLESQIAANNSGMTGSRLWDEQVNLYLKLLENPALAPSGSSAEAFLANHAGSSVEGFATFMAGFREATKVSNTDQLVMNQLLHDIQANLDGIDALLVPFGYDASLVSPTLKAQVMTLETTNNVLFSDLADLKANLQAQKATALTALVSVNNNLPEQGAFEIARKSLNAILLSRALGNPLNSSQYSVLKDIAAESPLVIGHVQSEAAQYLGLCEQAAYLHEHTEAEEYAEPLGDATSSDEIQVYPNPSADRIQVALPKESRGILELRDMTGRALKLTKVVENAAYHYLDVAGLPNGLYKLSFLPANGGVRLTQSIAIQH